jgi:serine/threonine protein kinase
LQPRALSQGLPTGTGLGKYRILEPIHRTHNATLYKARDAMLDRLVIVKQMAPELSDNPIACGHFKREAQILARIQTCRSCENPFSHAVKPESLPADRQTRNPQKPGVG